MASEARRAVTARYRERNREVIRAKGREYQKEHPGRKHGSAERQRQYRAANPDKVRQWRANAREKIAKNPEKQRERQRQAYRVGGRERALQRQHGLGFADLAALLAAQDGKCYLCGDPIEGGGSGSIAIDHDHSCCPPLKSCNYCRRGITCGMCNPLVGFARDDPERLRRIADNLEAVLLDTRARIAAKPQQLSLITMDEEAS